MADESIEKPALKLEDLDGAASRSLTPTAGEPLPQEAAQGAEVAEEATPEPVSMADVPELQARAVGSQAVDPRPMSNIDPVIRMRAFLQGDIVMADLYEMSRQELFDIAAQGQLFFDTGKLDEAATVFEGLVALDPYEGSFHTGLGAVYQQRQKLEEASIEYDRAIALNENDLAARCNRAEIRVQQRQFDAAADDIKEIALRDPEGASGHSQRAKVLAMALASMAQQALEVEDEG
ncbi:MAG: hypothetical protein CMH55_03795 [Myxococcales bacterium]|nr:hypothetical protein [Myxococcales bacterium]